MSGTPCINALDRSTRTMRRRDRSKCRNSLAVTCWSRPAFATALPRPDELLTESLLPRCCLAGCVYCRRLGPSYKLRKRGGLIGEQRKLVVQPRKVERLLHAEVGAAN